MIILLLIFITACLLALAGNIYRLSRRSVLTFSLVSLILCQTIWLWNVGVLYMVDILSVQEAEFWFRLTRIGSLMTPTFLFLAITQGVIYSKEKFGFFNKIFTRTNFLIYFALTSFIYYLNWTPVTVQNLYLYDGGFFDLYFPNYGEYGWVQLLQISTLLIWLSFAIIVSLKMKNPYIRAFLLPFSVMGIVAATFGLMSFLKDLVIITNILSITTFTLIIQYSFIQFREKVLEHKQKRTIEEVKRNYIDYSTSSLVHELRNPLSVLQGYFYMLKKNDKLDTDTKRVLVVLDRSSSHIENVLTHFSEFILTKEINLAEVCINKVIEETIEMMSHSGENAGVTIHPLQYDKKTFIELDTSKFSQVFINLYKNSIEALEYSKRKEIFTTLQVKANEVRIEVRDTGSGIPERVQESIFQPFKSAKEDGMGLGLSICSNIVSAHSGELTIKETGENGTTFLITLPIDDYSTLFSDKKQSD